MPSAKQFPETLIDTKCPLSILAATLFVTLFAPTLFARPIVYSDRSLFESQLGTLILDDYTDPGYRIDEYFNGQGIEGFYRLTNSTMSSVLGETEYESTWSFNGRDGINTVFQRSGSDPWYCSGCNASFKLNFTSTSVGSAEGVYGAGVTVSNNPLNSSGIAFSATTTFADGSSQVFALPNNDSASRYWGITSDIPVESIHFGIAGDLGRAYTSGENVSFSINDLTIGSAPSWQPPESPESPGTASLLLFSGQNTSAPLTVDNFDPSLPTILVTHGWQRGEDQFFGDGNLPRQDTINEIVTRLDELSIEANVILYNWEGAYTTVAKESYQETQNAGVNLATQLSAILGSDYEQSLHLIGHSHGAGVNGFAVASLWKQGIDVDLLTILDTPMDVTSGVFTNADFARDFFAVTLDGDAVGYVENYPGDGPAAFGTFIQGAGNYRLPGGHGGVPVIYGSEIVALDKIKGVFLDTEWPWLTPSRNHIEASSLPKWEGEELQITTANFKDWLTLKGISYDVTCEELGVASGCNVSDVYRLVVESSPSAVSTELIIPNNVTTFMFDYVFGNTGDGDWISLYFEEELLWELSGLSVSSGLVGTAFVDIRDFLGTTGELIFLLNSVGESNLEFAFANLRFVNAASSVPAPGTILLISLGLAGLALARRRKTH